MESLVSICKRVCINRQTRKRGETSMLCAAVQKKKINKEGIRVLLVFYSLISMLGLA
ncbi:hypothetical protein HanIR_Chr17g0855061 [Helianthus annuus]|nr:hypothetical protein HanIR_Chr17g0855061 [Helianthus annuus]